MVQSGYSIEYTPRSSRQELKHDHVQFGTPTPVRSALCDSVPPPILTPAGRIGDMPAQSADMPTTRLDFAARERTTDQSAEDTRPQGQTDIDSYLPSRPPPPLNYVPRQKFFDRPVDTCPPGQTDVDSHLPCRPPPSLNYVSSQKFFDYPYRRSSASCHNYPLYSQDQSPILDQHGSFTRLVLINNPLLTLFPLEPKGFQGFHNFQASKGKRTLTSKFGTTRLTVY